MKGKARFIKRENGAGEGRVYRLHPPYLRRAGQIIRYVWVSAISQPRQTYIFEWDAEKDEVASWTELPGSIPGVLDHRKALRGLGIGYEVEFPKKGVRHG